MAVCLVAMALVALGQQDHQQHDFPAAPLPEKSGPLRRALLLLDDARDAGQAIPLHGTYLGSADAFVGMDVSINVVSADEEAET